MRALCLSVALLVAGCFDPDPAADRAREDASTSDADAAGVSPDIRDVEMDDSSDARDGAQIDVIDGGPTDVGDMDTPPDEDSGAADADADLPGDDADLLDDTGDVDVGPTSVCIDEQPEPVFCGETCTTVHKGGPPRNRVALVVIGDGFIQEEMAAYAEVIDGLAAFMFSNVAESETYVRYSRYINLYRIDLVSPESGVDIPGEDIWVDTPLDGEEGCTDYRIGLCNVNWDKAHDAFDDALADSDVEEIDWRWITLNHEGYFGETHYPRRGNLAVFAPHHRTTNNIALHEGGHGFHQLGDTFWSGDETYQGREPRWANLTTDPNGARWEHWLGYEDPVLGTVGAYEGGMARWAHGIYRPNEYDKMGGTINCLHPNDTACPFDVVSREKMVLDIYGLVRPLDGWLDNAEPLIGPENLWVDVVACDVVKVDWFVDDVLVAEDFGEVFDPAEFDTAPGEHEIRARAYDDTAWVRAGRESLEQEIRWTVVLGER